MSNRPPRLAGFSYVGFHRYSLTFCVQRRLNVFVDSGVVDESLSQISLAAGRHEFAIPAYCFMPDHLHLLVEGQSERSDLTKFAHLLKQRTSFAYQRSHRGMQLWQNGYFEHVIRDDEVTQIIAKYILENPVRRSLVKEPMDYLFSGSLVYRREQLVDWWNEGSTVGTP